MTLTSWVFAAHPALPRSSLFLSRQRPVVLLGNAPYDASTPRSPRHGWTPPTTLLCCATVPPPPCRAARQRPIRRLGSPLPRT